MAHHVPGFPCVIDGVPANGSSTIVLVGRITGNALPLARRKPIPCISNNEYGSDIEDRGFVTWNTPTDGDDILAYQCNGVPLSFQSLPSLSSTNGYMGAYGALISECVTSATRDILPIIIAYFTFTAENCPARAAPPGYSMSPFYAIHGRMVTAVHSVTQWEQRWYQGRKPQYRTMRPGMIVKHPVLCEFAPLPPEPRAMTYLVVEAINCINEPRWAIQPHTDASLAAALKLHAHRGMNPTSGVFMSPYTIEHSLKAELRDDEPDEVQLPWCTLAATLDNPIDWKSVRINVHDLPVFNHDYDECDEDDAFDVFDSRRSKPPPPPVTRSEWRTYWRSHPRGRGNNVLMPPTAATPPATAATATATATVGRPAVPVAPVKQRTSMFDDADDDDDDGLFTAPAAVATERAVPAAATTTNTGTPVNTATPRDVIPIIAPSLSFMLPDGTVTAGPRQPIVMHHWLLSPRFGFSRNIDIESFEPAAWHTPAASTATATSSSERRRSLTQRVTDFFSPSSILPSPSVVASEAAAAMGSLPPVRVTGTGTMAADAIANARAKESRSLAYPPQRVTPLNAACRTSITASAHVTVVNDAVAEYVRHLTRIAVDGYNHMMWSRCNVEVYPPGSDHQGGYIKPYAYDYEDWLPQHRQYLSYGVSDQKGSQYYYRLAPIVGMAAAPPHPHKPLFADDDNAATTTDAPLWDIHAC